MGRPRYIPPWMVPRILRSGSTLRATATVVSHLLKDYGWLRSVRERKAVDAAGMPIPWFTYPAIDYIRQLDLSEKIIFEWGAGFSTLFWSSRAKRVISVETDPSWYSFLKPQLASNCELILATREVEQYSSLIHNKNNENEFDLIIIDGTGESRVACSKAAIPNLRRGGLIILDNSDLWPTSSQILRDSGLIQVDFTGFAPMGVHCHTTSVFFSRDFNFIPLQGYQPHKSVAQPAEPFFEPPSQSGSP
jgi:hypothetical protein